MNRGVHSMRNPDGTTCHGDRESYTTKFVWVWFEANDMWIPKCLSRHFPSQGELIDFAKGLGTVAFEADEETSMPTDRPEGEFAYDMRIGQPWVNSPLASKEMSQKWKKDPTVFSPS